MGQQHRIDLGHRRNLNRQWLCSPFSLCEVPTYSSCSVQCQNSCHLQAFMGASRPVCIRRFLRPFKFHSFLHSPPEKLPTAAALNVSQPPAPLPVPTAPPEPPREPTPPPASAEETEPAVEAQTGWEEPTTVQNPPWEDLQHKPYAPVSDPWLPTPTEEVKVRDEVKPAPPEPAPASEPDSELVVSLPAPQPKEPVSGLSEAVPKHVAPIQVR